MKILIELTYYRPHISGLTIYVERLARALMKRGHSVTILTSQYDKALPREEIIDEVRVLRVPVLMRISKGVVMPTFGLYATRHVRESDAISLHLPQLDAAGLAIRGKILKKPTLITYHCDLQMPPGALSQMANYAVNFMNHLAAKATDKIISYTRDYAINSPYLIKYKSKVEIIPPPVELPVINEEEKQSFRSKFLSGNHKPIIGIAARFASEKGVEVLLKSLDTIITEFPNAQVWFAGPYKNILGEEKYYKKCEPLLRQYIASKHWKFLGPLSPSEMSAYYPHLDVLVMPSLNSTESFGLVQIEAMMNGVPVIASNLPGVRQPVLQHKFGRIIPVGDSSALSKSIMDLLKNPIKGKIDTDQIVKYYSPDVVAARYESVISNILL